jgi:hypothetical protein
LGIVTGWLAGGTIAAASIDDDMTVAEGGMLTISQDLTLGANQELETFGGDAAIQGSLTVNPGRLWIDGGGLTVDGDLSVDDIFGYTRGDLLIESGSLTVTGTARFGEHSFVSDQVIIESRPDDDLAVLEANDLVFGSQTISTSSGGQPVYTHLTTEIVDVAGELIADNALTINAASSVEALNSTALGAIIGAGVKVGGTLVDFGNLSADGAGVFVTIGGSAQLLEGSLGAYGAGAYVTIGASAQMQGGTLTVSGGGALEIGGTGGLIADDVVIDAGASLTGYGRISTPAAGTTTVAGHTLPTYSDVVNNGTIEAQGGTLTIDGALSGPGQVLVGPNSNLVLGGAVADDVTIMFLPGGDETITIDDPGDFKGVISSENFEPDDKIDLPFVPYVDPGSTDANPEGASFNFETGEDQQNYVLQVVEDDQTYNIPINQDVQFEGSFKLDDDVHGGTLVTYESDEEPGYSVTADADGTQGCSVLNTEPRV